MSVEVTTSPPRTTLLGTIFSPVFNFFSPAKNGKNIQKQRFWVYIFLFDYFFYFKHCCNYSGFPSYSLITVLLMLMFYPSTTHLHTFSVCL